MHSRRDLIRLGLGGLLASSIPSSADDAKRSSTLFVFASRLVLGGQTVPETVLAIDPDQDTWREVSTLGMQFSRVSPDGKTLAYFRRDPDSVWTVGLEGDAEPRKLVDFRARCYWSSDGKSLVVSSRAKGTWKVNADGTNLEKLPFPDNDLVFDWSKDGKWLLVDSLRHKPDVLAQAMAQDVYAIRIDGTDEHRLTRSTDEIACWQHRFTPDSRSVIYLAAEEAEKVDEFSLHTIGIDGKDDRKLLGEANDEGPIQGCFSPDGKRLAAVMFDRSKANPDEGKNLFLRDCKLQISGADGKNGRLLSVPMATQFALLDWL